MSHGCFQESWKVTVVYFLLLSYFIFYMNRDRFFLFPMLHLVETPLTETVEEIYFENEMAAWVYPPRRPVEEEKIMVYFNGNAGNVSTRLANVRVVQQLLPEYRIYNLEYPGYGLSADLPLSMDSMGKECLVACQAIVRRHPSLHTLGFWGESLGALVQSHVFAEMAEEVDWMVHMNGVASLRTTLSSFLHPMLHALVLPVVPCAENASDIYSKKGLEPDQKLLIAHASHDEVVSDTQSKYLYFHLKSAFPDSVYFLELRGKHNGVLLQKENQDVLQEFLNTHLS